MNPLNTKLSGFSGGLKFILAWIVVLLVRLVPGRPANVEPMLATVMPFSKKYGVISSFLFGFLGICALDIIMNLAGIWTLITAVTYGLLGVVAFYFFRSRKSNRKNYVIFGIAGTLIYDVITGLMVGPLFFGQPFMVALIGQIPFTIAHLIGTTIFAYFLSPLLYKWIVTNEKLEIPFIWNNLSKI